MPTPVRREGLQVWRKVQAQLVEYGTAAYPPSIRRRLRIMNVTAYCVAIFTLIYTLQQLLSNFAVWKPVIAVNLGLVAVAIAVPFLHRFGALAGVLTLGIAESIGLLILTSYLGREAGLHIQYIAAICVYFVVIGLDRLRLIILLSVISLVLYLLAWAWFPEARLPVAPAEQAAVFVTAAATTFTIVAVVLAYAFRLAGEAQAESDALLHNILPASIVDRLKSAPQAIIADEIAEGSILFADLKGFVALVRKLGPADSINLLSTIVNACDGLADQWGVEKIKTIGDAYMAAAGLPEPDPDHAARMAGMALSMLDMIARISREEGLELSLRIGIASGPVLAGVIGAKRLAYDVWGDTVNLASRLEGLSMPGRILVSGTTKDRLEAVFDLEQCGPVTIKGFGVEDAWYLIGRRGARADAVT